MSNRLHSEELSDIMLDSLLLSSMLIEKFEIMQENGLVAYKAKQSVKNTIPFLENYLGKVFSSADNPDEKKHFTRGADILFAKEQRVLKALADKDIMIIADRRKLLYDILYSCDLHEKQVERILLIVDKSEILKL